MSPSRIVTPHPTAPGSDVVWEPSADAGEVVELRVALPRLVIGSALARVLPGFRAQFPHVRLLIEERDASAAAAVKAGVADLAVYAGPERDHELTYQMLTEVPMLVASPRGFTWAEGHARAEILVQLPLIVYPHPAPLRQLMDSWFTLAKTAPRDVVMSVRDTESVLRYVGLGLGHAVVPRLGLRASSDYQLVPGEPGIPHYQPMLVFRVPDSGRLPAPTVALVSMIEEVWPALLRVWQTKG